MATQIQYLASAMTTRNEISQHCKKNRVARIYKKKENNTRSVSIARRIQWREMKIVFLLFLLLFENNRIGVYEVKEKDSYQERK
jgi:hypothetical protein